MPSGPHINDGVNYTVRRFYETWVSPLLMRRF